jgi:hypothetical protein
VSGRAYVDANWLVDRLVKVREFSSILIRARERLYFEPWEAKRLIELLRDFVEDYGDEYSKRRLLELLEALERAIDRRDSFLYRIAGRRFGRSDVVPIPEIVAEELPVVKLLELLRALKDLLPRRGVLVGRLLEMVGSVDVDVIDALSTVGVRGLIASLGIIFENFLSTVSVYSVYLQRLVEQQGIESIDTSRVDVARREVLSVLLEPVARSALAVVRGGIWEYAQPRVILREGRSYEFDAVALDLVNRRLYVAEVELSLDKPMGELRSFARRKVAGLQILYESYLEGARSIGVASLCVESYLVLGFTAKRSALGTVKEELVKAFEELTASRMLCRDVSEAVEVVDLSQMERLIKVENIPKEFRQLARRVKKALGTLYMWWLESRKKSKATG